MLCVPDKPAVFEQMNLAHDVSRGTAISEAQHNTNSHNEPASIVGHGEEERGIRNLSELQISISRTTTVGDAAMDGLMRSMGVDPHVVAAREAAAAAREEETVEELGGRKGKKKNVQDEEDDAGEEDDDDEEEEDELLYSALYMTPL